MRKQLPVLPVSPLPPLYAAWIDQLLAGPIPAETDASCQDCAMLSKDDAADPGLFFNPQTKCCTYIPTIPNYLVGGILDDPDPSQVSGRVTVENRIRAGVGVTPLGLEKPPNFEVLYEASVETLFGQSRSLRCPHYLENEGGRCGIWKHRASICATWHCKYVRGQVGQEFWMALQRLLSTIEISLTHWCVLALDIGYDALKHMFPPRPLSKNSRKIDARALDGQANETENRKMWGNWTGREVEFYKECGRLVKTLSWQDVTSINRGEMLICSRLLSEAYASLLSEEIPARLKVGVFQVVGMDQDSSSIRTYNPYDPLNVPKELVDVLGYFDGRATNDALAAIRESEHLNIELALIRKLTDFGVLVPV